MRSAAVAAVNISAALRIPKKHGKSIIPDIIKMSIIFFSVIGSVFTFLSCFEIPVKKLSAISAAAISCIVFSAALKMKRPFRAIISLSASAISLLLTLIFRNSICAGLANIINIYLARVKKIFRDEPLFTIAEPDLAAKHMTVFICFITALICITAVYCVSKKWYAIGLCIPPLILPISVLMFGLEPDNKAFALVIAGCAAAIAWEVSSEGKINTAKYSYASSFSGLAAAVFALLFFAGTAAAVKNFNYERSEKIDDIYNKMTGYIGSKDMKNVIDEVVTFVKRETDRSGAIDHGKLGEYAEIYFDGKTVLQITMPKPSDTFYLRGFVGSEYTGRSWKELPSSKLRELKEISDGFENPGLYTMLFDSYSLKNTGSSMPKYGFAIKNISAGRDHLYMPYNLVPESVSRYSEETGGGFDSGEETYFGQFYDPSEYYGYKGIFRMKWNISRTMFADEAAYRRFVYENYLELPDEHTRLDEIFDDNYYEYITAEEIQTGKSTLDEMTVFSRKLYYIKSWLRNNCEYSLSAGKLPAGQDFIDRFLETRKGSCSHFASTAVMMCRAAGIPARYVEGYIVKPSSDFPVSVKTGQTETIDITDARAHAWVEIYVDGFGWYPMEFTSGYGNVRTAIPTDTLPTETETEMTETEEITETTSVIETTVSPEEAASGTAVTTTGANDVLPESSQESTSETTVTTVPAEADEQISDTAQSNGPPSVGFGIFGIKGGRKVDIFYDLTNIFFIFLGIFSVIAAVILRRRICLAIFRKKCHCGGRTAAIAAYKKFCTVLRRMKLPLSDGSDGEEYAKRLKNSSPLLSDGTAEVIMQAALKASFGEKYLTKDDTQNAVIAVKELSRRYYATLSKFGKFKAKYVYCIV